MYSHASTRMLFAILVAMSSSTSACANPAANEMPTPQYDAGFWDYWSDGHAEIAAYDMTFHRYGQPRQGTAVTIFVTETFSDSLRVKADPGRHPESDRFPVMKLNLVQDFPTGIYDYNMMTSVFVALEPRHGKPPGFPTKVSFSAQEWCGHAYHQLLFDQNSIRQQLHSYFDSEADKNDTIDASTQVSTEDVLLLWARGMAAPLVKPGESIETKLLTSLTTARLNHVPLSILDATLSHSAGQHSITIPSGTYMTNTMTAVIKYGPTWTFHVETAHPHRIIKWSNTMGQSAELIAADRFQYWQMNEHRYQEALRKLGLTPRPARTP